MIFSSLVFLFLFLPFAVIGYYMVGNRWRNGFLLAVSLLFYAWGEPVYVLLMILSIAGNYRAGQLICSKALGTDHRKAILVLVIILNLFYLGFFKYFGFLAEIVSALSGLKFFVTVPRLPLGISFYTFQVLSYLIDVYRGDSPPQTSCVRFGLYIGMFPQLVAGPIVSYGSIVSQLEKRSIDCVLFFKGINRLFNGLAKKVLLADCLGQLWEAVKYTPAQELGLLAAWTGLLAFTLQIYFDFSGYSDMAIGLAMLFGFRLQENFQYPYLATTVSEFWRRWHISLGKWFKTYVYLPMGGSRCGRIRLIRNLTVVWLLTGLWHGASFNFILWGAYFGVILIIEKLFLLEWMKGWPRLFKHLYTLFCVMVGWVIFEYTSLAAGATFLSVLFGIGGSGNNTALGQLPYLPLLFAGMLAATPIPGKVMELLKRHKPPVYSAALTLYHLCLMVLSAAYLVGATYHPFLYFRF